MTTPEGQPVADPNRWLKERAMDSQHPIMNPYGQPGERVEGQPGADRDSDIASILYDYGAGKLLRPGETIRMLVDLIRAARDERDDARSERDAYIRSLNVAISERDALAAELKEWQRPQIKPASMERRP